jgi:PiT family inorganic phosphate transporter
MPRRPCRIRQYIPAAVSTGDIIVGLVVAVALVFDFTNGFHDTANAMATTIATGALKPRIAVGVSAALNFVGAFVSITVAATVAKGIVDAGAISTTVIFGGLVGAIAWNLATWWFGIPSSSSHALIGGMLGATLAAVGTRGVEWDGVLAKVVVPAVIAPVLAGVVALAATAIVYRMIRRFAAERAERGFRWAQVASSGMVSLAHGTNDAQKTMGVISLALIANGTIKGGDAFSVPTWVVVSCGLAIALGTYAGGWRIIKTLGTKVTEVRPPQGFSSEEVAATVILASSHFGYPLSTTHVVSGAVTGSGVGRPGAQVAWAVARRIVTGWVLTLPAAAATAAIVYGVTDLLGGGVVGPLAVTAILAICCTFLWRANRAAPVQPEEVVVSAPTLEPVRA